MNDDWLRAASEWASCAFPTNHGGRPEPDLLCCPGQRNESIRSEPSKRKSRSLSPVASHLHLVVHGRHGPTTWSDRSRPSAAVSCRGGCCATVGCRCHAGPPRL